MKTPDISTIHETVLHGDMRFHLMVHEFASDPSRSERVTSHWHEEYELLFLTEGNGTAHVNGRALPISAGDILFFNSGEVHSISAPPGVPLTFYAVVFGLDLHQQLRKRRHPAEIHPPANLRRVAFSDGLSPEKPRDRTAPPEFRSHPLPLPGGFFLP